MKFLFSNRLIKNKKWIFFLFFINISFSQIDLQINLLNTAQYTLSNFNDPYLDLWTVVVSNYYPFPRKINLEVVLNYNDIQPAIWALNYPIELGPVGNNSTLLLRNSDFLGENHGKTSHGYTNPDFKDLIELLGYLPAGDFQLIIRAYFELDEMKLIQIYILFQHLQLL